LPKLFANNAADGGRIYGFPRLAEVLPKRLIDHRLVASPGGVGPVAKRFQHLVVEVVGSTRQSDTRATAAV
jgi:hypothetical protein